MIYFDNAATSLPKPPEVAQGMAWAVESFGNPGRSFATPGMQAAREIFAAREMIARLTGCPDPARVAFTSGVTESMSLLCRMLGSGDHVIASEIEHNSVLRPLWHAGCEVDLLPSDPSGRLMTERLPSLLRKETRAVFVNHGSNVTGEITDVDALYHLCREAGVLLVLDVAQTLGTVPVTISMADILCFSGHKGLFGPMGTGGLILRPGLNLPVLKTGGTGFDTFASLQQARMPDLAEAGTPNAPGIYGLLMGARYVETIGIPAVAAHDRELTQAFFQGLFAIPGIQIYGDFSRWPRLPVVSFRVEERDSAEVALALWEKHQIVTRSGGHCAPLIHQRLGTQGTGLVRASFGWFNTLAEVRLGLEAIGELVKGG
ncbi:MAG: aminotransferase class V-fold PLP-dependent enzyme [Clostridiales bacterium]|nr:aminotransferase class V-fold PLP-dependent enzyme [Clostridiales bacterium]